MATDKQVERQKRSVLHFLKRFSNGAAHYQVFGGYTSLGRAIRQAAVDELRRENRIEQIGYILRIKVQP